MDVELEPPQPQEVVRAVEQVLSAGGGAPDPWWRAGVVEALDDDDA